FTHVDHALSLANTRINFTFTGRASHAAAAPHLGRSALDAVELMNVGVNYLREHMPSDARIHYAMLDGGGVAANVVQAFAKVHYAVCARDLPGMQKLLARVVKIAEGAAMMTETKVEASIIGAVSNLLGNTPLEQAMDDHFERLGPVPFDAADRDFARRVQATLGADDVVTDFLRVGIPLDPEMALHDSVVARGVRGEPMIGSTDVGDVSWTVPTVQARVATHAIGTPGHSWQVTAQGKAPAAHKGMVHAAKVMAGTALECLSRPALIEAARADHAARLAQSPYRCPIPDDVRPPIQPRPAAASAA
ncbi:MAG: amidohydrolase, partial [Geminicoccaceae bacterium]